MVVCVLIQFLHNEIEGKALYLTKDFNHSHKLEELASSTSEEVREIHQVMNASLSMSPNYSCFILFNILT